MPFDDAITRKALGLLISESGTRVTESVIGRLVRARPVDWEARAAVEREVVSAWQEFVQDALILQLRVLIGLGWA